MLVLCETFWEVSGEKKGHTLLPPLFPSGFWNVDVMAGAQAAILNQETICYGWQQNIRSVGPWWLWFYLTNPRLPASLLFYEYMSLICLSHCYSGITYNMQQNLVLTNIPFDAQKSKLNLYFSFCNANNHASVFYLPYVYLSILKVEHFFPTLSSFLPRP